MTWDEGILQVQRYIRGNDTRPRFINFQNTGDLARFKAHFHVGNNSFISIEKFSANDELPNFDSVLDTITLQKTPTFLVELTTGAKLLGREALVKLINELAHFSKEDCRTIIICYQCEDELAFLDARLKSLVYLVEGNTDPRPQITLIPEEMPFPLDVTPLNGIHQIVKSIEKGTQQKPLYVRTKKTKSSFPLSMISIAELHDAYDVLCMMDPHTKMLSKQYGTPDLWGFALKAVSQKENWINLIADKFGGINNLELAMYSWNQIASETQWLLFLALKMFGAPNNRCLHIAAGKANFPHDLIKESYRCLLGQDLDADDYWDLYDQRKALLETIGKSEQEAADYCAMAMSKDQDAVYYYTDGSKVEREYIISFLDRYGQELGKEQVLGILQRIYPDLYAYLHPYRFEHDLLSQYFQTYTFSKVLNKVLPDLFEMMEEQATKREFNILLKPRSELMDAVPKDNVTLYYVDALGVEFLSYISEKCFQMGLQLKAKVARCNIPSITALNKEFLAGFDPEDVVSIREIDDVKHQGKENYDYRITKLPLHLIRELEVIDETISKAKQRLNARSGHRVFLVADHGATRMAVIQENTINMEVDAKGTHGGRVCEHTDEVAAIPQTTEANGYCVLANYDRFRGGRKASVETHGGATLEEVAVPIIEITALPMDMEIIIKSPVVQVSSRKQAEVVLFSKTPLQDVTVLVNGKFFETDTDDAHTFRAMMPEVRRAGKYLMDVYSNHSVIWRNLEFTIEKEGFKEIDLF